MLKLRFVRREKKEIENQGFLFTGFVPTGWAPCCKTWLKKMKFEFIAREKNVFRVGVCALHTFGRHVVNELKIAENVGRHVVNEPKVGCHVVVKLEIS